MTSPLVSNYTKNRSIHLASGLSQVDLDALAAQLTAAHNTGSAPLLMMQGEARSLGAGAVRFK
jgi:hypothetical protein